MRAYFHVAGLIVAALLVFARPASAQLYIFVRTDAPNVTYSVDEKNGRTKAVKRASQNAGEWKLLVESNTPGFGAVFCVSGPNGDAPTYFYSIGQETSKAAVLEAREKARAYAARKKLGAPFIMRFFRNTNRYPLEKPDKVTTFGVRG
jgi:hypothetical protein